VNSVVRHAQRLVSFVGRYAHAAGLVAYTFSLGLSSPRARHLIARLARDANYQGFPRAKLPTVSAAEITEPGTSFVIPHPVAAEGNVALFELVLLAKLVREESPAAVFEIGTFNGRTAVALAANAPADAMVYTLDLPADKPTELRAVRKERAFVDKPVSGELVQGSAFASKIRQLFGDSATFDFSPYQVDLVFIDGSHSYEYVMNDSMRALSMLRGGRGTLIWHDYGEWEGVTRALNELHTSDPRFAGLRHISGTTLAILDN
jgi:predicted O-methyltransferase YrrM